MNDQTVRISPKRQCNADNTETLTKRRKLSADDRVGDNYANHRPTWRTTNAEELHRGLNKAIDDDDGIKVAELLQNWEQINSQTISTLFWAALNRRQIDCIRAFMDANLVPNPNFYTLHNTLPMFAAVAADDVELVELLCGCKLEVQGVRLLNGVTPLHHAVERGNVKIVQTLLKCGFDPNTGSQHGEYPLHIAIRCSHDEIVLMLLESSAKPGQPMPECRTTPLMKAAEMGSKAMVAKLLEKKIKVDARDMYKETALFKAVCANRIEIVEMLIAKGARPDIKVMMPDEEDPHRDEWGDTPLTVAVNNGRGFEEIVKLLLDTKKVYINYCCAGESTPIQVAIRDKNETVIKYLLDAGTDVTKVTAQNRNSLHFLTEYRNDPCDEELAKMLISSGCDVNLRDNISGCTPLLSAAWNNNVSVAKCLVQANACVDVEDTRLNKSSVEIAIDRKNFETASFLIKAGCNLSKVRKHKICTDYNGEFINWLSQQMHNPPDLKSLCRTLIRKSVGVPYAEKLSTLSLSNDLNDFMLFTELDDWNDCKFPPVKMKLFVGWPTLRKIWELFACGLLRILPSILVHKRVTNTQ